MWPSLSKDQRGHSDKMEITFDETDNVMIAKNSGKRSFQVMRKALDAAVVRYREKGQFNLWVDWSEFQGIEESSKPELIKVITQLLVMVRRAAIVCGQEFQAEVDYWARVSPVPVRRFELQEMAAARAWLAG